jgi:hypothetical protein
MCEYVSFLASDSGPTLQLYFSTGLNSHANIRKAYNMCNVGAECEWTGNSPDNLVVRHEDKDTAKLIKQMILDKYPTLRDMLQDIKSVRDTDGTEHTVSQGTYLIPEEREAAFPSMLEKHKLWVETEGKEGVCADFSWWNLYSVNLRNANLQDANLQYADLQHANLRYTNLQDANLQNTNLRNANLQYANLRYTNLQDANLQNTNLRNANLQYANLQHANLQNADLQDAYLPGADLRDTNLLYANLQGADLRDTNLQGARNVPDYSTK